MTQEYLNPTQEKARTRPAVSAESLLWCWGNMYSQAGQDGMIAELKSAGYEAVCFFQDLRF